MPTARGSEDRSVAPPRRPRQRLPAVPAKKDGRPSSPSATPPRGGPPEELCAVPPSSADSVAAAVIARSQLCPPQPAGEKGRPTPGKARAPVP